MATALLRRRGRSPAAAAATLLALGSTLLPVPPAGATFGGPPAATVPTPSADPFYRPGPRLDQSANGEVLRVRRIDASVSFVGLRVPTRSWQIAYRSLTTQLEPVTNVVTLIVPTSAWAKSGRRPVVAYQAAEDSTGSQCSPSYALRSDNGLITDSEKNVMSTALDRGFALAVTDHEGPHSAFMAGTESAHMILDAVRAVQQAGVGGMSAANPVGLWGYSGGGNATASAAEQAATYAPELRIAGAAIGGASSSLSNTIRKLDGGPFTAYAFVGIAGLLNAYPDWDIRDYLTDAGRADVATADDACIVDVGLMLAFRRFRDVTTVPDILAVPSVRAVLGAVELGSAKPSMPLHLYYSLFDEAVPVRDNQRLVDRYCSSGVRVSTDFQALSDHITLGATGSGPALDFLADVFAGRPTVDDCRQ